MKKLGLIGGISWHTTIDYYTYINKAVNAHFGGFSNASCIIHSFNMSELAKFMEAANYDAVLGLFTDAAMSMKKDGAEGLLICANTMHMFADRIEERTGLKIISMITATAEAIRKQQLQTVGLLGTRPTMDMEFYIKGLDKHGIKAIVPEEEDKDYIHENIFVELSCGIFKSETAERYVTIMDKLTERGAEGIILGCTDIPPLFKDYNTQYPLFDTTHLHAEEAVRFMLDN